MFCVGNMLRTHTKQWTNNKSKIIILQWTDTKLNIRPTDFFSHETYILSLCEAEHVKMVLYKFYNLPCSIDLRNVQVSMSNEAGYEWKL